jgi:phytoene synthase
MPAANGLSYCGDQVRRFDHDRFLTALFAPADRREALFALYAFNLEVAKTREVVSEPLLGQMRLQWWHDAIGGLYEGRVPAHEVLMPLGEAIDRFGLTRGHFERVISAREADLTEEAPPTLADLERYAEDTNAPLIALALEALGVRDGAAHRAAGPAGAAWALAGLMRAVPFHARQRRVYLPTRVVEEVAVDMGELFELRPHAALARAVETVSAAAGARLAEARTHRRAVPRAAVPALLPATLADSHLKTLRRAGHDVFDPRVQMGNPLRQARLTLNAALGRY